MISILGLDPGLQSGICQLEVSGNNEIEYYWTSELNFLQLGLWLEAEKKWVLDNRPLFAVESFLVTVETGKKSQAPWSLEAIGLSRYFAYKYECDFELTPPSAAKKLITDVVIKGLQLWRPGQIHAMDSVRQALFKLITKYHLLEHALKI